MVFQGHFRDEQENILGMGKPIYYEEYQRNHSLENKNMEDPPNLTVYFSEIHIKIYLFFNG